MNDNEDKGSCAGMKKRMRSKYPMQFRKEEDNEKNDIVELNIEANKTRRTMRKMK